MNKLNELINRLIEVEKKWISTSSIPEDLSTMGVGITKTEIAMSLGKIRLQLETAMESGQEVSAIYLQQISAQLSNSETYVTQHIPSNPSGHMQNFLNILYALGVAVDLAIIDPTNNKNVSKGIAEKLKNKLAESLSKSELANRFLENTNELISKNKTASQEILQIVQMSQDASTKIQDRDRTTAEAINRISETEKKSVGLVNQLEGHLTQVSKSSEEIRKQQMDLSKISETLTSKLIEAQRLLDDANRLGLAGAFETRRKSLKWPAYGWVIVFLFCIVGLSLLAADSLKTASGDWHSLLFRLPFSAPLVWLGWFAVKQYGYTRRIQEDYSFKIASAMSFQGYKNEVDGDTDLIKMLQRSAIENFSANPLRIYEESKNHGSPLHELLVDISEDKLKKILELAKILTPTK